MLLYADFLTPNYFSILNKDVKSIPIKQLLSIHVRTLNNSNTDESNNDNFSKERNDADNENELYFKGMSFLSSLEFKQFIDIEVVCVNSEGVNKHLPPVRVAVS